jgi:transposase
MLTNSQSELRFLQNVYDGGNVMSVRLLLTDEAWAEIASLLAKVTSRAGRPPVLSDRLCIEAVLYRARTGLPWCDLPKELGHWDAVSNRFRRWEGRGGWRRLWEPRQTADCPRTCHLFIAATMGRAHQHAAGAFKKHGGQAAQAVGRSRGGWSTNIHAGCRDARTGVAVVLTAGHCHESPVFAAGFAQVPPEPSLPHASMDKAYDSYAIREPLIQHDMVPVIPPKSNRLVPLDSDKHLSKFREKVERFFNNLKQFRRMATRYETLSQTFLALIHLVAVWIIVK